MTKSKSIAIRDISIRVVRKGPLGRASRAVSWDQPKLNAASVQDKIWERAATGRSRDGLVLEHLPLVKAIAAHLATTLPAHVDFDDLVHAGIVGLIATANKFDSKKQVCFSSYAKHRIRGAILDSLRQLDWASRDMRRRHKQVETATRELAARLRRNPTEAEVAEKLGIDEVHWRRMMLDRRNVGLVSASTWGNKNDDLSAPNVPCPFETHPDSIWAHKQLRGVLGEVSKTLSKQYQKVLRLYYTKDLTMKEIGLELGIGPSRVSQIHKSALGEMAMGLRNKGIDSIRAF